MSLTSEESKNIEISVNYYNTNVTNIVGYVEVKLDGKSYYKQDIIQKETIVEKESFWVRFKRKLFSLW